MSFRQCRHIGCPNLVDQTNREGYCSDHAHEFKPFKRDQFGRRGANERGYDFRWMHWSRNFLSRNPQCCRCPRPATVTDHKIPFEIMKDWYGGNTYQDEDYQPMCTACNVQKGRTEDAQMLRLWRSGQLRKPLEGRGGLISKTLYPTDPPRYLKEVPSVGVRCPSEVDRQAMAPKNGGKN